MVRFTQFILVKPDNGSCVFNSKNSKIQKFINVDNTLSHTAILQVCHLWNDIPPFTGMPPME